jgi:hypothetical protein
VDKLLTIHVLNRAMQGNSIPVDAPPSWETLQDWLRVNNDPWLLLLDNGDALIRSSQPGIEPSEELDAATKAQVSRAGMQ